ncbi:hypothetical protein [Corallincola spongiicola]|uniref:Transmembrane protein n=1 Tax=Corallincola spongiicola TaxID=2520508 RepID=A0ABY1WQ36_9GAMM|nr:hypothetical protein [Corallincola spongiicola]TAA46048.1 hypothetical protein EXY25_11955 [Corallincola spongiicola]
MSRSTKNVDKKPNRKPLIAIVAAFILPVVIAYLVLNQGWYQGAVLNKGELIASGETIDEKGGGDATGAWLVVFTVDRPCRENCQQAIDTLQNVWLALGREQQRAQLRALGTGQPSNWQLPVGVPLQFEQVTAMGKSYFSDAFYLVDPLGNLVLRYPYEDGESLTLQSQALLKDLRKLMKNSKIG